LCCIYSSHDTYPMKPLYVLEHLRNT
jgi:hypothetical protein